MNSTSKFLFCATIVGAVLYLINQLQKPILRLKNLIGEEKITDVTPDPIGYKKIISESGLVFFNPCVTLIDGKIYIFHRLSRGLCNDLEDRLKANFTKHASHIYYEVPETGECGFVDLPRDAYYEDCRVIQYTDTNSEYSGVYGVCHRWGGKRTKENEGQIVLLKFDFTTIPARAKVLEFKYVDFYSQTREKNWTPFIHPEQGLCFIYDINVPTFLKVCFGSGEKVGISERSFHSRGCGIDLTHLYKCNPNDPRFKKGPKIRGGSQAYVIENKLVGIGHTASPGGRYANVIYTIDLDTAKVKQSPEFMFGENPYKHIQFTAGLVIGKDITLISFGLQDCKSLLTEIKTSSFLRMALNIT